MSDSPARTTPTDNLTGSLSDALQTALESPARSDRYELLGEIARGGMGIVYQATDTVLGREVAVKVLQERFAPTSSAARRFLEEARITAQLQHPGIPPVHDVGSLPDGRPFLAMKLIKGRTLDELLKGRPNHETERGRFLAVFEQVCQAVGYAHAHKVIHRDLKPSNIMVGSFAEVQVMDWGLAKVLTVQEQRTPSDPEATVAAATEIRTTRDQEDGSRTQAGSVLGTPAYIPPEQAGGEIAKIDERADVFGLGAVLCVILTGKPPYAGTEVEEVRLMAIRGSLADCYGRLDGCGAEPELIALAKRCLSFAQLDRPCDAGEVARAVAAFRSAADERARKAELDRVAAETEAREQRKRRRVQFILAASVLAFFALVGGGAWWLRADRQAREAAEAIERLAAEERVLAAEAEAERHAAQRDWSPAVNAARRAVELAQSARVDGTLRDRVEAQAATLTAEFLAAERDRRLTLALLDTVLPEETMTSDQSQKNAPRTASLHDPEARHRLAFAEYGVDIDARFEEAAAILSVRPESVRLEIAAALDSWGYERRERGNLAGAKRLAALVDRLDADPDRRRLRSLMASGKLRTERVVEVVVNALMPLRRLANPPLGDGTLLLRRLASEPGAAKSPIYNVMVLALALHEAGDPDRALALLKAARHARPDAVVLAYGEAMIYLKRHPQAWAESIAPLQSARAVRPDTGLLLVLGLLNLKQTAEAIALAEDLRRRRPGDSTALRVLAIGYFFAGRMPEAEVVLREVIKMQPGLAHPRNHLGAVLFAQNRADEAETELRAAVRLSPDDASIHKNLGNALAALGRTKEAESSFHEALRIQPEDDQVQNGLGALMFGQERWTEAEAAFRRAVGKRPDEAMYHVNLGNALRHQNRFKEAEAAYREGLRIDPGYATGYRSLSVLLQRQQRWAETEALLGEALRRFPADAEIRTQQGKYFDDRGRPKEAETAYREALRLDPSNASTLLSLGVAIFEQSRWTDAEAVFRDIAQRKPKMSSAHFNLGNTLYQQRRYSEAEAAFREAMRLQPTDANYHVNLGHALAAQRRWSDAEAEFRTALRLGLDEYEVVKALTEALTEQGRETEVTEVWREYVQRKPKDFTRQYVFGTYLFRRGQNSEAETALRVAVGLRPDSAEANCNLGHALRRLGRFSEAHVSMRRGHELGTKRSNWSYPSAMWVSDLKRLVDLEARLPALIAGKEKPVAADFSGLLELCYRTSRHLAAAQFAATLLPEGELAGAQAAELYDVACSAAAAAAGRDAVQTVITVDEWSYLTGLAYRWLRAVYNHNAEQAKDSKRWPALLQTLTHWKRDKDLPAVRDPDWLAAMPEVDRKLWEAFWADVDALIAIVSQPMPKK